MNSSKDKLYALFRCINKWFEKKSKMEFEDWINIQNFVATIYKLDEIELAKFWEEREKEMEGAWDDPPHEVLTW